MQNVFEPVIRVYGPTRFVGSLIRKTAKATAAAFRDSIATDPASRNPNSPMVAAQGDDDLMSQKQ